jgi:hypothetical protein
MIKQQRKFYKLKGPSNNSKINEELAHRQRTLVKTCRPVMTPNYQCMPLYVCQLIRVGGRGGVNV